MPHLFLFTQNGADEVVLCSFDPPQRLAKEEMRYSERFALDYETLHRSERFTPLHCRLCGEAFEGECVSLFSPTLCFILRESVSPERLVVSETFESGGRRTFGFDEPIAYRRRKPAPSVTEG